MAFSSKTGFLNWILFLRKELSIPNKLSDLVDLKSNEVDELSQMALEDPSTHSNPKKLSLNDMKIMYKNSLSGDLF